ncbi:DUF590-domain-containing protein [Pseudovirgaria hyperparasitica]|uniref:DUF590-domain-containing protein n=1 Tax=Pseudovirgaria hyperparasitica TaxID=470096 RepID=A0A6A6WEU4_9PEZI|nr:DUF590-domain-containing protein [Pseudovirgaria hyperparasitica]KAF2761342.1 DUF590-domain-containing protein [Pseudovirgaria hyperparasitica]
MTSSPKNSGPQTNLDVDYVISYRFADSDKATAAAKFEKLCHSLSSAGLATEVRNGENHSLLLFVKVASEEHLYGEVYRSRVHDWIHGVRAAAPPKDTRTALESEPLSEAERLRIIYQLITNPEDEGGAGITPKEGEWKEVESIFALHDHSYNKDWIKQWSRVWYLKTEDLDEIRNRLGEKIAFYFAFTQSYFAFLVFPAIFGASAWLLLGNFSPLYAIVNGIWCIVFTEWWKHQESDLAVRWGVRNVSKIDVKRKDFEHEREIKDPVTGETIRIFSGTKRLQRQLLQLPFALGAAALLGTLIATCFGIEVFISEVYNGPFKTVLVFLPTGILTIVMPILTGLLTDFATRLTAFENYETHSAYEAALTRKIFIINFITSYLPIFLTAFVYVPFGSIIVPYLDVFSLTVKPFAENEKQLTSPKVGFAINPDRLKKQVIYFTVTAQVVNMAMEVIVPYLKRQGFMKYKEIQSKRAGNNGTLDVAANDPPEEHQFLKRVRNEATLSIYDVTSDLREMVVQFGYLSLFSVVWPVTAVSFLVNNWFELRADAIKICVEMQRPVPWRSDTIGPWLDSLEFLAWVGSMSTAALVFLFSDDEAGPHGTPYGIKVWGLLLAVFFSEHIFLTVRWGVRVAISKLESPGLQKERRERFMVRKQYFNESLGQLSKSPAMGESYTEISRQSLEDDARDASLSASSPESRFWSRQKGWQESAKAGTGLMEKYAAGNETKKSQ